MRHVHRLCAALATGVLVILTTGAPNANASDGNPFLVAADPAGDLTNVMGETVDVPDARGLDILRVRQRLVGNRLVVVSHHRNLTRANTNLDPDATVRGRNFSLFAAYVEPKPMALSEGYTLSFDAHRKLAITDFQNQAEPVPCPVAAEQSRINLETDRVRYVVPVSCISGIRATRTTAQVIRYTVTGRDSGVERIEIAAMDMNEQATPRIALR